MYTHFLLVKLTEDRICLQHILKMLKTSRFLRSMPSTHRKSNKCLINEVKNELILLHQSYFPERQFDKCNNIQIFYFIQN